MNDKSTKRRTGKWTSRFVLAAVIQGLLALALAAYLLYYAVFGEPAVSRIVAGGGAGMWLTAGFLAFLILGVGVNAMTPYFYRFLEMDLGKSFRGKTGAFPWMHVILWNVGIVGATFLMINAGLRGGGAALPTAVGGLGWNAGQVHSLVMAAYPPYIAAFLAVALVGAAFGIIGYLLVWARPTRVPEKVEVPV